MPSTMEWVPLAKDKIVFDRFHIMKHMNDAVDKVRKQEHRALMADGDETLKRPVSLRHERFTDVKSRDFFPLNEKCAVSSFGDESCCRTSGRTGTDDHTIKVI